MKNGIIINPLKKINSIIIYDKSAGYWWFGFYW
mgnify:CR=1 FL=1